MRHMRTMTQLCKEYKAADPDTAINVHFIRRLLGDKKIPFYRNGKRFIICKEDVDEYFQHKEISPVQTNAIGKIRPIKE